MKYRISLALLALIAAGVVAGCGGGGSGNGAPKAAKLQGSDIAVVGGDHITQADFDKLMAGAQAQAKAAGQTFPKQGTSGYQDLKSRAVNYLVQIALLKQKAAALGVTVSDKQVNAQLQQIIQQRFGGSHAKYEAELKKEKTTEADVKDQIRTNLLSTAIENKVTANLKITDKQVDAYYKQHATEFPEAAPSRDVRHILVKQKALATSIYNQLKNGTDKTWCTLAKKYSQDPSSKDKCGKLTVTKGETVPVFNNVVFGDGKTGVVHAPVYDSAQYKAYFIIEPLSAIKAGAAKPTAAETAQIRTGLLSTKKANFMDSWVKGLEKSYCTAQSIKYTTAYTPSPDICSAVTTTTGASTATTTG